MAVRGGGGRGWSGGMSDGRDHRSIRIAADAPKARKGGDGEGLLDTYRRLVRYPLQHWPRLVLILALTALISLAAVLQPWPLKILVDYALGTTELPTWLSSSLTLLGLAPDPATLVLLAGLASLALFALGSFLSVSLNWIWASTGQKAVYDLQTDLFDRLERLSLLYHNRNRVGDSLGRLSVDSYSVYSMIDLIATPWQQVLTIVMVGAVAWSMDPFLTLLTFLVALAMGAFAVFFGPRLRQVNRRTRQAETLLMSFVHQTLTAIPLVQAFGLEDHNQRQFQDLASGVVQVSLRNTLIRSVYAFAIGLAVTLGTAVVLFMAAQRVLEGTLSVGSIIVFLAYLGSLFGAFRGLLNTYGKFKTTEASMDRVLELLESDEIIIDRPDAVPPPPRHAGRGARITLENLTFGYEPERPVLRNVSLDVRPGETIAIVGQTGAGKTTLVSMVPRFYDPWEGRVLFDGIDARSIELAGLRSQVSSVLQDPYLLPMTVEQNISYGRPQATREEVVDAARAAGADEFIQGLPKGYDTIIGERGTTLSGGQRQRLAIARAFLRDSPVLILDEPTSALDAQTEAELLTALERLKAGRTTFIIAHRLSTIRNADRIVVMDDGRVAEIGRHEDLLAAGGLYARLHDLQFAGRDGGER
ncbi:MAG: ABC transporter ATP-binding protein [Methanomassiliicoccus sp.]|nr:ABC transporter ATP-binding protein [Methanomassiliicoccus sp.]